MLIRKMKIEDYENLRKLWLTCGGLGLNSMDDTKAGIQKFIDRNPETCFVAEKDNKIIGAVLVGNDGRRGYIYHTAVSPDYRNMGIGRILVETALKQLEALGIAKAALVVFEDNKTGNSFWERLGFTERNDLVYRNKSITKSEQIKT